MKTSPAERAAAGAATVRTGRLVLEHIEAMLIALAPGDARSEQNLDEQDAGRLDGLWERHDELKAALELSPARAAAAIARVRRECLRVVNWLERESATDGEPGTAYDWGVWQADFDVVALWPGR